MIHSQWSWVLASWENHHYSVHLISESEFATFTVIQPRQPPVNICHQSRHHPQKCSHHGHCFSPSYVPSQLQLYKQNNFFFCRKNSSWTSKTVGRWVQARHQMAFICREFDRREKTGCEGTSESGFAIRCTSSSAFLFAECKYIRICVCLTARTKVHFCKFDAIIAEWFSDLCLWIKQMQWIPIFIGIHCICWFYS